MAQPAIQTSFHAGEWAPALNARVDLAKYHSAAALLKNFFVDYRGGASTRAGTKYILQAYKSATAIRLIGFQASFTLGYILEFGDFYVRFFSNGAPVLEASKAILGATQANPVNINITAHSFSVGEWIFVQSVVGMTQLNSRYFIVRTVPDANHVTLNDLYGNAVNSTAYTAYVSGGTAARVYTLATAYAAADLALLKFSQSVDKLYLCHPGYVPYVLTIIGANNWTLAPITFGASINAPTGVAVATTLAAGSVHYAYVVTSVDANGQESGASTAATLASKTDLRTVAGSNNITWTAASGAQSYNVYKAEMSYSGAIPTGAAYGFIGNATGVAFADSNIAPDFSLTPPIVTNPFSGAPVVSITVTAAGTYTTVPTVSIAAPTSGSPATAQAILRVQGTPTVSVSGHGISVGDILSNSTYGIAVVVATISGDFAATCQPITYPGSNAGNITSGATPANPVQFVSPSGSLVQLNLTWGVGAVTVATPGTGYTAVPAVTFSSGVAAATAVLGVASSGNPSVNAFFQQRFVLAAPPGALQTLYMSQPGTPYNFNVNNPIQADNAITEALVSKQLNEIKSMVPMPSGLIMLTSNAAWQVNGQGGPAVSAIDITANAHAYNGASDVPPIVANFDILFVQAKGSIVRDLTYNFYANIYTGTDISVLSSHLFYGYTISEWAWAEEPFKIVWCVRDDGTLLSLTFLKEQELIGWAHSDTDGLFKSVATVTETVTDMTVDAIYLAVQRTINGQTLQYIERMAERIFPNGAADAWCVDAGLQYSGVAATVFTGGEHLAGETCTGLADGVVIPNFVMSAAGGFALGTAASKVTVGLPYTPQLKTLQLDLGEPTVQGKRKKISAVTLRCQETLGLKIGSAFTTLVPMKDLVVGNVGSATNEVVAGLITGDARTIIDPTYTVPGQYCVEQPYPFPASILGVIPEITVGDTAK